jgi:hypothetical protein
MTSEQPDIDRLADTVRAHLLGSNCGYLPQHEPVVALDELVALARENADAVATAAALPADSSAVRLKAAEAVRDQFVRKANEEMMQRMAAEARVAELAEQVASQTRACNVAVQQSERDAERVAELEQQVGELGGLLKATAERVAEREAALREIADFGHEMDDYDLPPRRARKIARAALAGDGGGALYRCPTCGRDNRTVACEACALPDGGGA